jgi:hypothetical protein
MMEKCSIHVTNLSPRIYSLGPISDLIIFNQIVGILATQKNHLVESNELKAGSVIKLQGFVTNVLSKDPPKYVL